MATGACSYQSVKSILKRGLDRQPLETSASASPLEHENIRGAAYFDSSATSQQAELFSEKEEKC
jgi:hypothetical protein